MSLESAREGLRAAFKAVHPNWNTYSTFTEVLQLPAMVVYPNFGEGAVVANYGMDFNGSVRWHLKVRIFVEIGDLASADRTLSDMVSPDNSLSVPAILDARRNREYSGLHSDGCGIRSRS
jgi:hypothetical protein